MANGGFGCAGKAVRRWMLAMSVGVTLALASVMSIQLADGAPPLESNGFRFSAAGDFGSWSGFDTTLSLVAASGSDFTLALGDLSYLPDAEQDWCTKFRQATRVEIVAGNHDVGDPNATGGNINQFITYCPHSVSSSLTGSYGKQYFFDYPSTKPLARFIFTSPDLAFNVDDGEHYRYTVGTPRYNWTRDAIDGARSAGIPWVIVASHKVCIAGGEHGCEIGADLWNLLIDRKVDLILQAHEHDYERSAQLALNATSCPSMAPGTNASGCVVDTGVDGHYEKGVGSVLVIQGTGGRDFDHFNLSDPESAYFVSYMDNQTVGRGKGIVTYDVGADGINAQTSFDAQFSDAFSIRTPPDASPSSPLPLVAVMSVAGVAVALVILVTARRRRR